MDCWTKAWKRFDGPMDEHFRGNGYYVFTRDSFTGEQICYGGGFRGSCVTYQADVPGDFERVVKKWKRQYKRNMKKMA